MTGLGLEYQGSGSIVAQGWHTNAGSGINNGAWEFGLVIEEAVASGVAAIAGDAATCRTVGEVTERFPVESNEIRKKEKSMYRGQKRY